MRHFICLVTIVLFALGLSSAAQVNGSGTPGEIPVWTGSGTPTETLGNSTIVETAGGNVGIGTTSPGATLSVVGQSGNVGFNRARPAISVTGGSGSSIPAGAVGTAGMGGGLFLTAGSGGSACRSVGGSGAAIQITGGTGATSSFVPLGCSSGPGKPGNVLLAPNVGNVGIGETAPAHTLEIKIGGTTLADEWSIRSSRNFKTDIQPLQGAIEKVERLQGVTYRRKSDSKHEIGVIAEDVAEVVPEVVSRDPDTDEVQGVDYSRLVALLIEAVKTQQVEIQQLKARVQELTNRARD